MHKQSDQGDEMVLEAFGRVAGVLSEEDLSGDTEEFVHPEWSFNAAVRPRW